MDWDVMAADVLAVAAEVTGPLRPKVEALAAALAACLRDGGKLMVCGNGGSAADAQHIAGELVNRFLKERRPYAGIALSTDASVMTSIANDYSYDQIFSKQVEALGRPGDMLLAISTSGKAANVIRAAEAAKRIGVRTVALTGGTGGPLGAMVDEHICIACTRSTPRIQEGHQLVFHALCERLEELLEG